MDSLQRSYRRGTKPSRYGKQPFRQVLRSEHGWSMQYFAKKYGLKYAHVVNVSLGTVTPSPELVEALKVVTGRPASELFTASALVRKFQAHRTRPVTVGET